MSLFDGVFGAGTQAALIGSPEKDMYDMRAQQYSQQLAQSMLATKQAVSQGVFASQKKPFNPNEDAAYTTPLSQLVTLWQANYGDQWVERFEDDFWNSARVRLLNNDKLEGVGGWYRIKEDA